MLITNDILLLYIYGTEAAVAWQEIHYSFFNVQNASTLSNVQFNEQKSLRNTLVEQFPGTVWICIQTSRNNEHIQFEITIQSHVEAKRWKNHVIQVKQLANKNVITICLHTPNRSRILWLKSHYVHSPPFGDFVESMCTQHRLQSMKRWDIS